MPRNTAASKAAAVIEPYSKNYGGSCYWAGYVGINNKSTT